MRRAVRLIGIAAAIVFMSSCGDSSGPGGDPGTFSATWADNQWEGIGGAYLVANRLHIAGSKTAPGQQYTIEFVSVEIENPAVGTFPLGTGKASFAELIGGDVFGAVYRTTPQAGGSVTITRYDGPGRTVEGFLTFEAELIEGTGSYGQKNRLKNGQFSAVVEQPAD